MCAGYLNRSDTGTCYVRYYPWYFYIQTTCVVRN